MRRGPVDSGYVGELFPSALAVAPMYYPTSVGKPIMLCRLCKRICYNGDSRYLTCLKNPWGPHLSRAAVYAGRET